MLIINNSNILLNELLCTIDSCHTIVKRYCETIKRDSFKKKTTCPLAKIHS